MKKRVILIFFLALMVLPTVNTLIPFIFSAPLQGDVSYAPDTSFSIEGWWTGGYQEQKEKHLNDHYGLRADFVRLHNQLEYSLFRKLHAKAVVEGKERYLYEKTYIDAYYGKDFRSEKDLLSTATDLEKMQQALKAKGKILLFVSVPGKATIHPQYIPDKLRQPARGKTNAPVIAGIFDSLGVNYMDIYKWYLRVKDTLSYPYMTKYNTHWSSYGSALAMKELVSQLERISNQDLPDLTIHCNESETYCEHDKEIMTALNLIFPWPEEEFTCIPNVYVNDSGRTKLKALILGDSFFWEPYFQKIPSRVFQYFEFWFYGNQRWGPDGHLGGYSKEDLKRMVDYSDVIIIVAAEPTIDWYAWMFTDFAEVLQIQR